MNFLIDPNISFVLLVIGFLIAILALFSPGTGVLELGALAALGLAGYGVASLPIRPWALGVMALALIPFILTFFRPTHFSKQLRVLLIVLASIDFVVGSILLYQKEAAISAVNPILIFFLAPLTVGFTWLIAAKILELSGARSAFDLDILVGMTGQVTRDIQGQGTVYVNGEEWSATSKRYIPNGASIRVIRREGLTLEVEPDQGK